MSNAIDIGAGPLPQEWVGTKNVAIRLNILVEDEYGLIHSPRSVRLQFPPHDQAEPVAKGVAARVEATILEILKMGDDD